MNHGMKTSYAILITKPNGEKVVTLSERTAVNYLLVNDKNAVARIDLNSDNVEDVLNGHKGLFIDSLDDFEREFFINMIKLNSPSESEAYSRATRGY